MKFDRPLAEMPRGIRNNNPGNIRHSPITWRGHLEDQSADAEFVQFEHALYGLRAMARILMTYQGKHHLRTISEIIKRYAPPAENDTTAYAVSVARAVRVGGGEPIDLEGDRDLFVAVLQAMVKHECGMQPYPTFFFEDAITLALARA